MDDGLQLFEKDGAEKPKAREPKWIFSKEPMCPECINHARDFGGETEGGKWPVPLHSPGCVHFKKQKYFSVGLYGHASIMTGAQMEEMFSTEEENKEDYDIKEVWLCPDQVESLPDFEGY